MILSGGLTHGNRLPSERELAVALDTSRSTVRTALHALAADGLIQIRRGRSGGSVVQSPSPDDPRASFAEQEDVTRDLDESKEFRLILEPTAAAFAADRSTRAERRMILSLGTRQTPKNLVMYQEQDQALHLFIAQASGNGAIHEALKQHFHEFFVWANSPFLVPSSYFRLSDFTANHAALVERIAAGDRDGACAAMEDHLARAYEEFAAAFNALRPTVRR